MKVLVFLILIRILADPNHHFARNDGITHPGHPGHRCVVLLYCAVMMEHLRASGVVEVSASEENPHEVDCGGRGYSVAFDPLDGSSIVDCNFAVGTIV